MCSFQSRCCIELSSYDPGMESLIILSESGESGNVAESSAAPEEAGSSSVVMPLESEVLSKEFSTPEKSSN